MGINALNSFITSMKKSQNFDKTLFKVLDDLASLRTRTKSPAITFNKNSLNELPKQFQEMTTKLKRPTVTLRFNGGKGQGIFGIQIKDGNNIVSNMAFNMHRNKGSAPHFQAKFQIKSNNENAFTGTISANPSASKEGDFIDLFSKQKGTYKFTHQRGEASQFTFTFNPDKAKEFEQTTGQELISIDEFEQMQKNFDSSADNLLKEIATMYSKATKAGKKVNVKTPKLTKNTSTTLKDLASKKQPKDIKRLIQTNTPTKQNNIQKDINTAHINPIRTKTRRTIKTHNPNTFADEAELIMQFEGKPTEVSANRAKDIIIKKMGYDSKLITVKISDEIAGCGGEFNIATGELLLDASMAEKATHFDVADVLIHELDHMDVAIKLAKKMGIDKFEKMILALTPKGEAAPIFNRSFYEKAIQQADITDFDAKKYIDFEKKLIELVNNNYTEAYLSKSNKFHYAISPMEVRARQKEIELIKELQARGYNLSSKLRPIEEFGQQPSQHIVKTFPTIEAELAKYPANKRNAIYNEAFYKAMEDIHPEFARLEKKLYTGGLTNKITHNDGQIEYIGEDERYFELWEQLYGSKEIALKTETELCEKILQYIK